MSELPAGPDTLHRSSALSKWWKFTLALTVLTSLAVPVLLAAPARAGIEGAVARALWVIAVMALQLLSALLLAIFTAILRNKLSSPGLIVGLLTLPFLLVFDVLIYRNM